MREDDYTGRLLDDEDEVFPATDTELYDWEADEDALPVEIAYSLSEETILSFAKICDGAKSLREAASMLYDFADELTEMSAEGWEIVDDIKGDFATAVFFAAVEDEDSP